MGGGTKYGNDAAKGAARDVIAKLANAGAPGFQDAVRFCVKTHRIEFRAERGIALRSGQGVELLAGDPPALTSGGTPIGHVFGEIGKALDGCILMNFALSGKIEDFDIASGVGHATLCGVQQQAA